MGNRRRLWRWGRREKWVPGGGGGIRCLPVTYRITSKTELLFSFNEDQSSSYVLGSAENVDADSLQSRYGERLLEIQYPMKARNECLHCCPACIHPVVCYSSQVFSPNSIISCPNSHIFALTNTVSSLPPPSDRTSLFLLPQPHLFLSLSTSR